MQGKSTKEVVLGEVVLGGCFCEDSTAGQVLGTVVVNINPMLEMAVANSLTVCCIATRTTISK